jgi:hypothetical protein
VSNRERLDNIRIFVFPRLAVNRIPIEADDHHRAAFAAKESARKAHHLRCQQYTIGCLQAICRRGEIYETLHRAKRLPMVERDDNGTVTVGEQLAQANLFSSHANSPLGSMVGLRHLASG